MRKVTPLLSLASMLTLSFLMTSPNASAAGWSYDTCIDRSGGRGGIPSVQWACSQTRSGVNACSAWIGSSSDSTTLNIYVNQLSGSETIKYWGMCTDYSDTTSRLWVDGDNDSIGDGNALTRGAWGNPQGLDTTLDIGKFVNGIAPTITDKETKYSRNITVGRCNGENPSSCSTQDQTINIIVNQFTLNVGAKINDGQDTVLRDGDHGGWLYSITEVSGGSIEIRLDDYHYNPDGYTFSNWGIDDIEAKCRNESCSEKSTDMSFYTNQSSNKEKNIVWKSLSWSPTNLYAYYNRNEFSGQSRVATEDDDWESISNSNKKSTGFVRENTTVTQEIKNCDPINGCTAKFWHDLRLDKGSGGTNYTITRSSNYYTVGDANPIKSSTETFSRVGEEKNVLTESFVDKLYPGQVVCETLTFTADIDKGSVPTTACASATGDAQPPDPGDTDDPEDPGSTPLSGNSAFINIKVRNKNVTAYDKYQHEVYAKPSDELSYRAVYNPILQYTARLAPQKARTLKNFTYSAIYPTSGINTMFTFQQIHNQLQGCSRNSADCWKNAFTVYGPEFNTAYSENYRYTVGNTSIRIKQNDHTVETSEVKGLSLYELATTNLNSDTQTTPGQVNFSQTADGNLGTAKLDPRTKDAQVYVPYNYINTTEIISNADNTTLYAGDSETINYTYIINPKTNTVTTNPTDANRAYATTVGSPKWKLQMCVGDDNCQNSTGFRVDHQTTEKTTGYDFSVPNMWSGRTGDNAIKMNTTINVPDLPAGTRVCLRSAVYPATSGADTNWSDPKGDHTWAYSTPVCFSIAKRPSFQAWGGNVYTNGGIKAPATSKGNLNYDYNTFEIEKSYEKRTFGSWGELGVIAGKRIDGFASGASLGYSGNNSGILSPNPFGVNAPSTDPGGSTKTSLCDHSPLTFANTTSAFSNCNPNSIGYIGGSSTTDSASNDKDSVASKFIPSSSGDVISNINLSDPNGIEQDNGIYYYYLGNTGTVHGNNSIAKATQVIHAKNEITIDGNLIYGGSYTSFQNMPKLVIYASSIKISCDVARIDALLIAENAVETCSDSDDVNSFANSHQLVVNGAIVAGKLIPLRTYGAATGANSIIPAEIINFDPSLYLWGNSKSDDTNNTNANLDVSSQKELAPRL